MRMQVFFFIYRAQHLLLKDKFLFMGHLFYKSITKSLDRGTMHFFLFPTHCQEQ